MTMRILLIVASAATVSVFGSGPAAAYDYPFCRKGDAGPGDCRYDTYEQCLAAISGTAAYCQPNYWLQQTPQISPHRRARRS